MKQIAFTLINEPNDFESCLDCVHAIKYLYDCYEEQEDE